ncbi:MAG: phage holin family protein [Sphingomonadales bacterium]|nr:phage holin family protein [Sphingomonadales bacterium]MDE2169329.1 phage holin family protein [Sphingomonadales bacterium]
MSDENGPDDGQKSPIALTSEIESLIAAVRAAISSEVAFQRARAVLASKLAGRIAGLAALALALVFFFLMALVVGLLLALAPLLGTWQALGIVVAGLVLCLMLAVWGAMRGWKKLKRILFGEGK